MLFYAFLAFVTACVAIQTSHVRLVDYVAFSRQSGPQTFLFRSGYLHGEGSNSSVIDYETLVSTMDSIMAQKGLRIPRPFKLIDISFYNNISDARDIAMEQAFFRTNPSLGYLVEWPIIGNLVNPVNLSASVIKSTLPFIDKDDFDRLSRRIPQLHSWMNTPPTDSSANVYLLHCQCGCDRTGEVAGSYAMQYLGWSANRTVTYDDSIPQRPIAPMNFNNLLWYCYHLQFELNYTTTECEKIKF
eukprot:PhF_6_TR24950/c2_g1_i2/m.34338